MQKPFRSARYLNGASFHNSGDAPPACAGASYWTNGVADLYQGDARALPIADRSVHCCVTSPPYWGLRDYGLADWEGGDPECDHVQRQLISGGQNSAMQNNHHGSQGGSGPCLKCGARQQAAGIGLEPTLSEWLDNIVAVGHEVWRVLRDDGTWWLNLGDAYAGSGKGINANGTHSDGEKQATNKGSMKGIIPGKRYGDVGRSPNLAVGGLPAKSLMGQPWRAAFALQDDGWILRSAIVWHKPNPMPESVSDRPTNAYEMVFLLTKRGRYFYDAEAVRQPYSDASLLDKRDNSNEHVKYRGMPDGSSQNGGTNLGGNAKGGANLRNVWPIPTQGRPDAHFATFPDELPKRCILAGTSEHGVCADCGAPWVRQVAKAASGEQPRNDYNGSIMYARKGRAGEVEIQTLGWQPTCDCGADTVPATVLDPFIGRGTTAIVAQRLGRRSIGVDLNPDYLALARKNLEAVTLPLI